MILYEVTKYVNIHTYQVTGYYVNEENEQQSSEQLRWSPPVTLTSVRI